jgi:hypothetical protein
VIDATGLKVFGAGEWLTEKHGERGQRTWRKRHLAVDPNSGEILASELTTTEAGDASLVGPCSIRSLARLPRSRRMAPMTANPSIAPSLRASLTRPQR